MPKPIQRVEVKSFSGGLVSDAPHLQFPENASIDELNFDLNIDGSRSRRKGIDKILSETVVGNPLPFDDSACDFYLWEAPSGISSLNFLVVANKTTINFYNANAGDPFSDLLFSGPNVSGRHVGFMDMVSVNGILVVVGGSGFFSTYVWNETTSQIEPFYTSVYKIRDVFGIEETINTLYEESDTYRGPANPIHTYNLLNQGWGIPRLPWLYGNHPTEDPINMVQTALGVQPSNADVVWQGLDFRNIDMETVGTSPNQSNVFTSAEAFNTKQFEGSINSGEPAAKGFFVIDAFNRRAGRQGAYDLLKAAHAQSATISLAEWNSFPVDSTVGGPTVVASFAGRAFFSGVRNSFITDSDKRSPNYANFVFFSQVVKSPDDIAKCYQEGDPTSREGADIVATDGGFIPISGAIDIVKLLPFQKKLLVFARNGVWAISGQEGGFTATNYAVEHVSNRGCCSKLSVVAIGNAVYYWGDSAAYRVSLSQFGDLQVEDITTQNLQKYYSSIDNKFKRECKGFADLVANKVFWLFVRDINGVLYQEELVVDIGKSAVTPMRWILPSTVTYNFGGYITPHGTEIPGLTPTGGWSKYGQRRYLFGRWSPTGLTCYMADYVNPSFRDWASFGINDDAKAYLRTGSLTASDVAVDKQISYLTMVFKNKDGENVIDGVSSESSCIGRTMWDFQTRAQNGRWSQPMQLYRKFNLSTKNSSLYDGMELHITKTKMRGRGKAFSLYLESEPAKDLHIVGWSLTITGNGVT